MKILEQIKPTEEEKRSIKKLIESVLKKIKIEDAKFELGGSYAKDTFLTGNYDIDVFVKFPYKKYRNKDISEMLHKKLGFGHKRIHGSRDYFQLQRKKYTFEFIPVLDIKNSSQAKNITDVSPLHKKWVKQHLKNPDEVRLVKKFCRAQEVYGAESYIKGFSGYVLEILIVHYGSFFNFIKAVSKWILPVYIDVSRHYKNKEEALKKINKSKTSNGLIIVDPTQKERNAAAAISKEKVSMLINSCKEYLRNPSDEFFIEKKLNIKDLVVESGENNLLLGKIKTFKGKKDVMGSKLVKIYDYVKNKLKYAGFNVIKSGWYFNKDSLIYYIVKDEVLHDKITHSGPPLKEKRHVEEFKKKHGNYKISKGKIYVELEREIKTLKDFSRKIAKDRYIKDNVRKIKFKIM